MTPEQQAEQLRRCAQALTLAGHVLLYNFNNEYTLTKNAAGAALGMGQPGELAGETTVG